MVSWKTTGTPPTSECEPHDRGPADARYPLYTIVTAHLLPLIAPSMPSSGPEPRLDTSGAEHAAPDDNKPHHALLTSHHLLSKTKRKDFLALASQLSLTGFSKVGHPGVYYAVGTPENLKEWLKEVKSWNWLNLRVRVGVEPIPTEFEERSTVQDENRGKEDGARGGLGRGHWIELEKISDALAWMRDRGREEMLTDIGIGA